MASRAPQVVADVTASEASRAEAHMKDNAPWSDRTGNARQGLFGTSEATSSGAIMALGHTEEYGPYLELGKGRMKKKYAIIVPTWRKWKRTLADEAGKALMELFRG